MPTADPVAAAAARAADPQPAWALVPPEGRARYLRRIAMAILDEVDDLALLLATETGQPRTEAMLAELLPSVGGLHGLADDGPEALADRRLGRMAALRAGRLSVLVQAPVGIVGLRESPHSAWAEPVLESAAALLAGNGVLLAARFPQAAERLVSAFERAGIPEGLIGLTAADAELAEHCDRVVGADRTQVKGTMLVLDDAPLERTVSGALWAAFAAAGRGAFSVGRVIVVPSVAERFLSRIAAATADLRVGDPRDPATEVGPLPSSADRDEVMRLVEASGGEVVCGGPVDVDGVGGAFLAPMVVRGAQPDAELFTRRVPGPVLAVVEPATAEEAIVCARAAPGMVSVWAGDRGHGERVARTLGAEMAWVNDHGLSTPAAPVRLSRHVAARQVASQPTRLRSARWLPYDPALVRASTATARLIHGRESERVAALRQGAVPLARTGVRLLREALGR